VMRIASLRSPDLGFAGFNPLATVQLQLSTA
jgi:hypothetical protein